MKRMIVLILLAVIAESGALASPITNTMTTTASGTLAGTAFTNAAITVTSVADTSQIFTTPVLTAGYSLRRFSR
jgi:hypothetical protein